MYNEMFIKSNISLSILNNVIYRIVRLFHGFLWNTGEHFTQFMIIVTQFGYLCLIQISHEIVADIP